MIISAKDLRFKTSMLFDLLNKGEEVILSYRGKAKAKIIGLDENIEKGSDEIFGMWSDKNDDVEEFVRDLRKGRSFDI